MRTTFEITHGALGAQNAILGGGRYDGLAETIGSKVPAPGIGFSIGEDRLVMAVEEAGTAKACWFGPLYCANGRHCITALRRAGGRYSEIEFICGSGNRSKVKAHAGAG